MTMAEKLEAAITFLGSRYVLHPSRRIPRGNYELPIQKCDVQATFARVRSRLAGDTQLVVVAA